MRANILKRNSLPKWNERQMEDGNKKEFISFGGRGGRFSRWGGRGRSDVERWGRSNEDPVRDESPSEKSDEKDDSGVLGEKRETVLRDAFEGVVEEVDIIGCANKGATSAIIKGDIVTLENDLPGNVGSDEAFQTKIWEEYEKGLIAMEVEA